MDEKPQKPLRSKSSGQHKLNLDEHLRKNTPTETLKAKQQFEQAALSIPPPRPMMVSSPEVQELGDATTKLGDSVDRICEALIMVFGRISDVSDVLNGQTIMLRSIMRWTIMITLVQGVVVAVIAFLVTIQVQSQRDLRDVTAEVERVARASEATRKTVDEVKKVTDESSRVTIAPDPTKPGGAVVRIVPPLTTVTHTVPYESSPSISDEVVIPLKVDEARSD